MNAFDVLVVVAAVVAGVGGYQLGFVARSISWGGMVLGLVLAARALPWALDRADGLEDVELLFVATGLLIAGAFIGQALGLLVGARLHLRLPRGRARRVDRAGGAAAGIVGVLVAVWLLLPAMADVRGWPARQARTSAIAAAMHDVLPEPPDTLQALREIIGGDRFPQVLDDLQAAPELGPPPAESGLTAAAAEAIARSTVKVEGVACRQVQDGSGAVVGPELVVTNAHVVAGEDDSSVFLSDGTELDAEVVAFDPLRDLALLRVPGLERPALPVGDAEEGEVGAVFGYPGGGDLRLAPFQLGDRVMARGTDIYDSQRYEREVWFTAAALAPGDSGAALVGPNGEIVGIAFAIAPDRENVAYALTSKEVRTILDDPVNQEVDTGPCIH